MSACVGIVLAGGRGRRLGADVPKALAWLGGETLLERAVATLAAACDPVLVVTPSSMELPPVRARRVADVPGHAGPLAGLVAGLEAAGHASAFVLGVDFPCVTPVLVRELARVLVAAPYVDAIVTRPGGIEQPLVAAYASSAAGKLRAALESGVTSLRGGLEALRVSTIDDVDTLPGGADALLNVNTPDDLERARRMLAAAGSES